MSFRVDITFLLLLVWIGVLPTWKHSLDWGYYPSGGVGALLIVAIILLIVR